MNDTKQELIAAWAMIDALRAQNKNLKEQVAGAEAAIRNMRASLQAREDFTKKNSATKQYMALTAAEATLICRTARDLNWPIPVIIAETESAIKDKNGFKP
jgi:predicted  nucleic acid-binding Zn-ribbon protein